MPKKGTLSGAFAKLGARPSNPRWSWSARTPDGTVVITLWEDGLIKQGKSLSYDTFGKATEAWTGSYGNRERIENMKWALEHCGGHFRVVIAKALDVSAHPRKVADCWPTKLIMKLVRFNEATGEFRAELVDPGAL